MSRLRPALRTVLPALVLMALPRALSSTVIHVPADRPTIAAALAAATSGDEIVIACGTYNEHSLALKPGITVRSATGSADCVTIDGQHTAFRIMSGTAVHGLSLEGLTFANGGVRTLVGPPPRYRFLGGGLYLSSSQSVTIRDCDFHHNTANFGAAVHVVGSHLTVRDSAFRENVAARGTLRVGNTGSLSVTGCAFQYAGGGISGYGFATVSAGGPTTIASSAFSNNPGAVSASADLLVTDCRFHRNASGQGGVYGIRRPTFPLTNCDATFRRCVFDSCGGMTNYFEDVAIFALSATALTLESCTFHDQVHPSALIRAAGGSQVDVTRTAFSSIDAAAIFQCVGGEVALSCSDLWASPGVEFAGCVPETTGVIRVDPLFCNAEVGDFHVASNSLCLPSGSPCGELIGALGEGCGPVSVTPLSWGRVKNLYR